MQRARRIARKWYCNRFYLYFSTQVKSKSASLVTGSHRFEIELYDTSTEHDVIISHEMVATGHAQTTPEATKVCIETLALYHTGNPVFWIPLAIVKVFNGMTNSQVLIYVFVFLNPVFVWRCNWRAGMLWCKYSLLWLYVREMVGKSVAVHFCNTKSCI